MSSVPESIYLPTYLSKYRSGLGSFGVHSVRPARAPTLPMVCICQEVFPLVHLSPALCLQQTTEQRVHETLLSSRLDLPFLNLNLAIVVRVRLRVQVGVSLPQKI